MLLFPICYHWLMPPTNVGLFYLGVLRGSTEILKALIQTNKVGAYGRLRITLFRANNLLKWSFATGITCMSALFVYSFNASVKYRGKLPVVVYAMGPVTMATIIALALVVGHYGDKVLTLSNQYVKQMRENARIMGGNRSRRYYEKVWRAVQVMSIEVGNFGYLSKNSGLELLQVWVDQTVTILLL